MSCDFSGELLSVPDWTREDFLLTVRDNADNEAIWPYVARYLSDKASDVLNRQEWNHYAYAVFAEDTPLSWCYAMHHLSSRQLWAADDRLAARAAQHPLICGTLLHEIVESVQSELVRYRVMDHPNVLPDTLAMMVLESIEEHEHDALMHERLPKPMIRSLSGYENAHTGLAGNSAADADTLAEMYWTAVRLYDNEDDLSEADDEYFGSIVSLLSSNPQTPEYILDAIYGLTEYMPSLLGGLACNANLPEHYFETIWDRIPELYQNNVATSDVRLELAKNPKTPRDIQMILAFDDWGRISARAAANLKRGNAELAAAHDTGVKAVPE